MADLALWDDGQPINLPAAAMDGLEWLYWLRKWGPFVVSQSQQEGQASLERTIAKLEEQLKPFGEPVDRACQCVRCRTALLAEMSKAGTE